MNYEGQIPLRSAQAFPDAVYPVPFHHKLQHQYLDVADASLILCLAQQSLRYDLVSHPRLTPLAKL
jgi:hypothetical protein